MTEPDPAAERAAAEFVRFPAGHDRELLYFPTRRTALSVSSQAAAVLQACRGFATLAEHARRAARAFRLGPERSATLVRQLELFVAAGVLPSRAEWAARLATAPASGAATPAAITALGMPTRNRPEALGRALDSYIENAQRCGHQVEYVVCDDSDTAAARERNLEALRALARRRRAPLRYADADGRRRYAHALAAESGLPPGLLEFALGNPEGCPVSHGAARNVLLLDALDSVAVQVDDDTLCRLAPVPDARPGLALSSLDDPTEFHFFRDRAAALALVDCVPRDFLGLHAELLGRDLDACRDAAQATGGVEPWEPDAELERALAEGGPTVVATSLGLVGDSGMATPLPYLMLEGASRERLLASDDAYRDALASREVLRAVRRATITNGTFCMSTNLGLDHRALLPPFFPVQRNEDGVFATLLRTCFRQACRGLLPWVLVHAPMPERRFDLGEVWRLAPRLSTGDLLLVVIGSFAAWPRGPDAGANLAALGRYLADLAALPLPDFEEFLRLQVWRWASARLGRMERGLREFPEAPAVWSDDLRRCVELWRRTLPERAAVVPYDLDDGRGAEPALAFLRRLLGRYGELLQHWPQVAAAARRLRARGLRPADTLVTPG